MNGHPQDDEPLELADVPATQGTLAPEAPASEGTMASDLDPLSLRLLTDPTLSLWGLLLLFVVSAVGGGALAARGFGGLAEQLKTGSFGELLGAEAKQRSAEAERERAETDALFQKVKGSLEGGGAAGSGSPFAPSADENITLYAPQGDVVPGVVWVESTPSGAQVLVDGRSIGPTPLMSDTRVSEDVAVVELRLPGYRPWRRRVKVVGGGVKVSATLERE